MLYPLSYEGGGEGRGLADHIIAVSAAEAP